MVLSTIHKDIGQAVSFERYRAKPQAEHDIFQTYSETNIVSFKFQVYFIIPSNGSPGAELHDKITMHNIIKNYIKTCLYISKCLKYKNN